MMRCLLVVLLFIFEGFSAEGGFANSSLQAAPSPIVAWVDAGNLYTWDGDTTYFIAGDDVIRPVLSPDGAWVAFTRGPEGDPLALWISDIQGERPHAMLSSPNTTDARRVGQVAWAGETLYLNTVVGKGIDSRPADDLWRVKPQSGVYRRLFSDGQGGQIVPSPDGSRLALIAAGEYTPPGEPARASGQIAFYTPATEERITALEFPAVASGSEYRWYAETRWSADSTSLSVAIPPPDLLYGLGTMTALWQLPVEGEAVQVGQVEADFFGLPTFSSDGIWIAYIERRAVVDQTLLNVIVVRRDGCSRTIYASGEIGSLTRPEWRPGIAQFTYTFGAPGEVWIGGLEREPERFPSAEARVYEIRWIDDDTYVFIADSDGAFTLNVAQADDTPQTTITTTTSYPLFDAISLD